MYWARCLKEGSSSSVGKESTWNSGDLGSIPGSGRSSGEGNSNPLQYSCLGNPMDRGTWQATAHGVPRVGHDLATKLPPSSDPGPLSSMHFNWSIVTTGLLSAHSLKNNNNNMISCLKSLFFNVMSSPKGLQRNKASQVMEKGEPSYTVGTM